MQKTLFLTVSQSSLLNEFLRLELAKEFDGLEVSNSKVRRLIFSQNVWVSASAGGDFFLCKNPAFKLKKNAQVKLLLDPEKFFYQKENKDIKFELDESRVLYQDDAIIVVNKPPHFPSEPTFVQDRDNLKAAVIRYLHKKIGLEKNPPYCGVVHRLDRDTSGAILFSKQRAANASLFNAFDSSSFKSANEERGAKKIYLALCSCSKEAAQNSGLKNGKKEFSVQNYLGRISAKSEAAKWGLVPQEKGGKFARTDFKILEEKNGLVLVQAILLTGRTHQIRVHLSQQGLPILGDQLYGGKSADRIFLHALSLSLPHPIDGRKLFFEAPLPPEFEEAFSYQLR